MTDPKETNQHSMTHLGTELKLLKDDLLEMMSMIESQFSKGKEAMLNRDQELAEEIRSNERRINAMELKIDRDCENILALFNPVAVDLRFVMACFKINSDLERLGDNADGIGRYILTSQESLEDEVLDELRFTEMYDTAIEMLGVVKEALEQEDTKRARKVFPKDNILNDINEQGAKKVGELIANDPSRVDQYIYILSIIRKLERVGDLTKNISEEIIFYLEAKVLKHKKQEKKG
ncbi:MAG: phosphate signaling complex protein PhoU [Flavobacteriales bacterium]